ncbi:MAG: polysaccharide biosynthesis tyrosine autokinase [Alphaproteobacteria bacterium]|nr:polysaccharide biosynthesis tyrosine autokinase [Alphaproteobacteria bacterium]
MLVTKPSSALLESTSAALSSRPQWADPFLNSMNLRETVRLLRRRLPLIAGVMVSGLLLGLLVALIMTPQYRAKAVVMLDLRRANVVEAGSVSSRLPAENTALRSEMDIIASRAIIDRVIDRLHLLNDPEWRPESVWKKLNPLAWFRKAPPTQAQLERQKSEVANSITKRLKVENDGRSFSINIFFESRDPVKAALIANTFADEYLVDQLESKYEAASRASKWLDERLQTLKKQVEASEKSVEEFRQKSRLIDIEGTTVAARQMDDTNSQLTEARGETSQAEAKLRSVENMLHSKGGMTGAADVLASPLIQKLREQEADLRSREAEMASHYGDLHPKLIKMRAESRELQSKIAEEVHKIVQGLSNQVEIARAKERQLEKELQKQEDRAGVEMKDSVTLRQLQREADANRLLYESFLNRFKQTSEAQSLQTADARIIARAETPLSPAYPLKWLFMLLGAILGGLLGLMLAFLVEYFDHGFRNAAQVEDMTGLPVIGLVPSLAGISARSVEDYVVDKPLSSYSEALRTVRTAIHFSNVDQPPKTVMVTSAMPKEGKTSFCLSMGRSLAKAGNKILLIDADLRRPRMAEVIGLPKKGGGLAALLAGDSKLKEVIKRDPIVAGLDYIPAMGKTPNAQDLLGSQQMQKLLREVAAHYDLVIVDTPPILAVSDAAMAARSVDTTLFLVRWATTPRDTAIEAIKRLNAFGCKIAGVVMTQVNVAEHAKYGEGYYHHNYEDYYAN